MGEEGGARSVRVDAGAGEQTWAYGVNGVEL